jgi:UPF0271 protein
VLYWPAPTDAALPMAAKALGVRVVGEIYPDLEYADDGTLILQRAKHRTDVERAAAQVRRFVETGEVETLNGKRLALDADSICIHGDGPNAVDVVRGVRRALEAAGCAVAAATGGGAAGGARP